MAWKRIERPERVGADFCTPPDLSPEDRELLHKAWFNRVGAYAPYSHYLVGAAVRFSLGGEHQGCNVEICTFTEGVHAEQNAIVGAITKMGRPGKITTVAIAAAHETVAMPDPMADDGWPDLEDVDGLSWAAVPCGHCLQIINEFKLGPETRLIGYHPTGVVSIVRFGDALPFAFSPEDIE